MTLLWPWALLAFLVVPFLVVSYRKLLQRKTSRQAELARLGLVPVPMGSAARRVVPALLLATVVLLISALTRPQISIGTPHREGTVVLAMDASASMAATDIKPSRIQAAKAAARLFVDKQPAQIRIAVVAFGDSGLILQPPTDDHAAVLAAVDRLTAQGGTGLGQGIQTAISAIAGRTVQLDSGTGVDDGSGQAAPSSPNASPGAGGIGYYPSSAVVLLSDGENTAKSDPLDAARAASVAGVKVYPVGLGSPDGGVVDVDGMKVSTALDEATLREIAQTTDGRYFSAQDEAELTSVYSSIDLGWVVRQEKMELTGLLAALAALSLLAAAAWSLWRTGRVI